MMSRDDLADSERGADEAAVVDLQAQEDAVADDGHTETRGVSGEHVHRARGCRGGELN